MGMPCVPRISTEMAGDADRRIGDEGWFGAERRGRTKPPSISEGRAVVTGADRSQPLAGLVGPAAEALFLRLAARGHAELGLGPGQVDVADPAVVELLDLGLAFRSGDQDGLLRPVDKSVALRLLIEHRQNEAISTQRRILDAWTQLTALLPRD